MIRVTGEKQKSEIAYAIQKYNKSTIYSYGDFCPSYLDTYMTYDTECDPISFCKFVMENLKEKVTEQLIELVDYAEEQIEDIAA